MNWVFGGTIAILAVTAALSVALKQDRKVYMDARAPAAAPTAQLPENHPPLDALNRAATLAEMSRNDPANSEIKVQLGNAYYDAGLYQEAIHAYEAGISTRTQDPEMETDLATCYHYTGQHDKAIEILNRVLQRSPGYAPALFNKGIVLQNGKNDARGAIAAWEELLRVNPGHPQKAELERRIRELKSASR